MSSLPEAWVDSLFARLAARYGAAWLRMWDGIPLDAVKADWAAELAGFAKAPQAIAHGLEHLPPDRPPTVGQFRQLCIGAPRYADKQLPAPKADPTRVAQVVAAINRNTASDPQAWARQLRDREVRGERLTAGQRAMWRSALGHELRALAQEQEA